MRERPQSWEYNTNMAFTECVTEMNTEEKKGIRKKNWKNRMALLLKKKPSQSVLHLIKNRSFRPSCEDVHLWAQSLDQLLAHKYGKAAFYVFLKTEFSEENIEFWNKCEEYRTLTSQKELLSRANSIYEEYVRSEAPKEINLDYQTRNAIIQSLPSPGPSIFLAAQRKVHSLMENNSYPRFLQSDFYQDLCATARGEAKHNKA